MSDQLIQHALEQAIRADEKAKGAHGRLDAIDDTIATLRSELGAVRESLSDLKSSLAALNGRVTVAASLGGIIGSALIGVTLKFIH